ncbi:MAG: hypothetical protein JWR14_7815 [Caballeronia sp.]|nr:hypothetical protein [Caballeronia sp.]
MSSKSGWSLLSRAREGALPFFVLFVGAGTGAAAARPLATRLVVPAAAVFTGAAVLDALLAVTVAAAARLRTAGAVAGAAEEASLDTALRRGRALRADPGDVTLNSS